MHVKVIVGDTIRLRYVKFYENFTIILPEPRTQEIWPAAG